MPLAPIHVFGPSRPRTLPEGDAAFHRQTTIHPETPVPGTADLIEHILAGYAYHLNVMPLDARMPDAGALVRATDIAVPAPAGDIRPIPVAVFGDGILRVTAVAVTHGRAVPAPAYRFDTPDGSIAFSGDTTVTAAEWAKRAGRGFSGTTTAGHDGLRRTLPRPVSGA